MSSKGNSILRYIFAYFLSSMCLFSLFTTEIYGDTTAQHGDPDTHRQQERPAGTHTKARGVTSAGNEDIRSHQQQQNPIKKHTGSSRDTLALNRESNIKSHYQNPAENNVEIHKVMIAPNGTNRQKKNHIKSPTRGNGDTLANNSQPGSISHIQSEKGRKKIRGDMLAPNGEPNTAKQQKHTRNHTLTSTDDDTPSLNAERNPYSQPTKIRTKSYPTSISASRRRAKRLKTRSLTLSDIPALDLSTSAPPPVSLSSTISNRTLSDAVTRAASNGSGVTRETVPADFTAISVVPSEEAFPKELPLPLLIASPVAAVSIIIFVCVAYCCHSSQLDARARQLALKYAVISTEPPACSRGIPSTSSVDMDLIRKTSLRPSTSRTSTPNLTPNGSKRGSMNWVAIGDQEVITYTAARRHSTFIL